MVWIFGGGFTGGARRSRARTANTSPAKGVLVVSMNYRLGIFGFFATQELAAEDPHHAAGNYGLMDQLACLQWVRRNIAAFGGDPDNVTIFGESAGSFAVSAQMASPLAKGLFAHAIGESGAAFPGSQLTFPPLAAGGEAGRGLLPPALAATAAWPRCELPAARRSWNWPRAKFREAARFRPGYQMAISCPEASRDLCRGRTGPRAAARRLEPG